VLLTAAFLFALSFGAPHVADDTLTVSAAVSLTEVMEAMGNAFAAAGGSRVTLNFGPSNLLARQIVNGAPVDVFVSADESQMELAAQAGMIEPGTRTAVVQNQLAVVTHSRWAGQLGSAAALAQPAVRRIAVGDPTAVPAGVYAKQYLQRIGLWSTLEPKLLPAASVRSALAAVANGAADAGIVYATDVQRAKNVRLAFVVRGPDAPPIVYPACVVRTSARKAAARQFLDFVVSERGAQIFREHGFLTATGNR
jgi:molybdate transport system substrate-binding protein